MDVCNYNFNLMGMEMLKIYKIKTELNSMFKRDDVLQVFNPIYINGTKVVDSRAILNIITGKKAEGFTYTINFFIKTEPFGILYYYNSNIFIGIAFFHCIKHI
jgi:hypothetical protein